VKEIELTQGLTTIVDDEWYPILNRWKWHAQDTGWGHYAMRTIGGRSSRQRMYMHRYIVMAPDGWEVDHVNLDKLDNRWDNLRIVKPTWNRANKAPQVNNTTGFKGVTFDKARGCYLAHIQHRYKQFNLGRFDTAIEAALAYNAKARELHGDSAWLNPIPDDELEVRNA